MSKNNVENQTTIFEDLIVNIIWLLTPKSKRGK